MVGFTVTKLIFNSSSSGSKQQLQSAETSSPPLSPPNDVNGLGTKVDSNAACEFDGKQKFQKKSPQEEETIGPNTQMLKDDESIKEEKKCETMKESGNIKSQVPWSPHYPDNVPIIFKTDTSGASGLRLSSSCVDKSQDNDDRVNGNRNADADDDLKEETVSVFS